MSKLWIIMCSLDNGKLNEESIFSLKVNKCDEFQDVKLKIQDELENIEKYSTLQYDQLFYVCNGKILNNNDDMNQILENDTPDIKIYDLSKILQSFQNQLQEKENVKIVNEKIVKEKDDLELNIRQLQNKIENQDNQLQELERCQKQIKELSQKNQHKEEQYQRENQNLLLKLQTSYKESLQQKKDIFNLQKEIDTVSTDYNLLQGELTLLQQHLEIVKKQIQDNTSLSKIFGKKSLEQLQIENKQIQDKYINEQKQNLENQNRIEQYIKKLQEMNNSLSDERHKNKTLSDQIDLEKTKISNYEKQIQEIDAQQKQVESEIKKQLQDEKLSNNQKQTHINQLQQEIFQLKNNLEYKIKDLKNIESELNQKQKSFIQFKKEIKNQAGQLSEKEQQLSAEIFKLQSDLSSKDKLIQRKENEIQQLNQEIEQNKQIVKQKEQYINDMNAALKTQDSERQEKLNKDKDIQDILQIKLKKLSTQIKQLRNKNQTIDGKIISPTEKLFQKQMDYNNFETDQNQMTNESQFEVSLLQIDSKKMEKLLQNGDCEITDAINQQKLGNWKIRRCLQANVEGTKRSLTLARILEEPQKTFNGKLFVIKEIPGIVIAKVEQAYEVAQNSLIAGFLLNKFQQALEAASDDKVPKNIQFQQQYLLICDEKIIIAEPLYTQDQYAKYNGVGDTMNKEQKIAMFLNAFSIYSYIFSKKQFIITNLQGFGDKLYDPIISTNEGVFSEEDLGEDEITRMIANYKSNPKSNGKQYLEILGFKIQ